MTDKSSQPAGQSTGPATDRSNTPVVDPSSNVLDLVEAAVKRLDDLRACENRRVDEQMASDRTHIREVLKLTADYEEKLSIAEAKRIDAIRAVDVGAVGVAAERAAAQATVLAAQVSASAETLRTLVATSASALAAQQTAIMEPITTRIAALERTSYEGAGKAGVTDPQMTALLAEMKATQDRIAQGIGARQGAVEVRTTQRLDIGMVIGMVSVSILIIVTILNFR